MNGHPADRDQPTPLAALNWGTEHGPVLVDLGGEAARRVSLLKLSPEATLNEERREGERSRDAGAVECGSLKHRSVFGFLKPFRTLFGSSCNEGLCHFTLGIHPNSPMQAIFTYFRPSSRYDLHTWITWALLTAQV